MNADAAIMIGFEKEKILTTLEHLGNELGRCSPERSGTLLSYAAALPGATYVEKFNGTVVRVPDPTEPLLGYYLMSPEVSRTHIPAVHSTSSLYSQSIQEQGFTGGLNRQVFFAPLPANRTTQNRFRSYAHEATAKNFYRALSSLYSERDNILNFRGEELTILLLARMKESSSGGRTFPLVGERIPHDLACLPQFQGQNIEVLIPVSALADNSNGNLTQGKFSGYEATTGNLSPDHIVHTSPLYPVFRERQLFNESFEILFRRSESEWNFALSEPFAPPGSGLAFVEGRSLLW